MLFCNLEVLSEVNMSDPIEIISDELSPPGSPFELPIIRNKVSEMFADSDETEAIELEKHTTSIKQVNYYHSLSESEDEPCLYNSPPKAFENDLLEINYSEECSDAITTYSSSSLSQSNEDSKFNQNVLDKKKLKELKAKEKAEKALKRSEKAKEKAERAAMLEKIRQSKPGHCMKYVTVILDENIININIGKKAIELFKDVEFKYKIEPQNDPCSVTWTREEPGKTPRISVEKHILFVWDFDRLVTSVKYCTLIDTFKELKKKYDGFRLYLAIHGRTQYYKKLSRRSDEESVSANVEGEIVKKRRRMPEIITMEQIDMNLVELEILLKVSTRLLKNHHELSVLLEQVTKAIAETPHRKEIEKRDMEKCWYARGDSRDCVKVDKNFNGLYRLWLQQLSQFNKSSLDIAKSIAEFYPSPLALFEAYEKQATQKEKDLLLQDIQITRGRSSSRRIGPELSRKICLLFGQENGDLYLSQE